MTSKQFLSNKLVLFLLVVLLAFLSNSEYRQYQQERAIEKEKQQLTEQQQQLENKNKGLSDSLTYLNSSDFKEQVARQQLNLKKQGEVVYNFSQGPAATPVTQSAAIDASGSNAQKWWNYFFSNK